MTFTEKRKRIIHVAVFYGIIALGAIIIYVTEIPCMVSKLTGLYCAGCGTVRMMHSLAAGDFAGAFGYNQFFMIFGLPIIIFILHQSHEYIKKGRLFQSMPSRSFLWIVLLFAVMFSIMRNMSAFSYLVPGISSWGSQWVSQWVSYG